LKPSDLLVSDKGKLKICDIGLARDQFPHVEGYVPTRYRAPEFILTWPHFSENIDIWSAGCIFAEMLDGKPLFPSTGDNRYSNITELLGTPTEEVLRSLGEEAASCIRNLPKRAKVSLVERFPTVDLSGKTRVHNFVLIQATELLGRMLEVDPRSRPSAIQCLEHEYLTCLHDPDDEPEANQKFDWSFNKTDLSADIWKVHAFLNGLIGTRRRCTAR